jgi:DNA-binding response OmpR family regulator
VDRSIDVHISRIRQAIEDDPRRPRLVQTVRGSGYVLALPPAGGNPVEP